MMPLTVVLLMTSLAAQAPAPAAVKPPRLRVETACEPCRDIARRLDDAYGGLDFLWDRRLSLERSIRVTEQAMAARAADIARLESAMPPSGRTRQQQDAIDALRRVNAQQRDGVDRQRRELDAVNGQIDEQHARIADLRARLTECEKQCSPPSPPAPPAADPGPPATPEPSFTLTRVPCPPCQRIANRIMALQSEHAELVAELEFLETTAEVRLGGFAKPNLERRLGLDGDGDPLTNAIANVFDDLVAVERELSTAWAALTLCLLNCSLLPKPIYTRPYFYGPVIGAGVLGGFLSGGGDSPRLAAPAADQTPPQPGPPPVQQPPPPTAQPSCSSAGGAYRYTGDIRMPRGCFLAGNAPVFASPIDATMTVQIDDSCSGTVTTRYPNTWTFAYRVAATVSGSSVLLRSTSPAMHTQPFGVPFNSTIELTVTGNAVAGSETHRTGSCTDLYDLRGMRQ